MLKIGITGHRKLFNKPLVQAQLQLTIKKILKKFNTNQFEAHCSLASGTDLLFAEMALHNFNAELFVYLPFIQEEFIKDFDNQEEENLFRLLLNKSKHLFYTYPSNTKNKNHKDECYLACGIKVAEEVDVLIAIWDNFPASGIGGTGDIVDYYNNILHKNVIHILTAQNQIQDEYHKRDIEAKKIKKRYFILWKSGIISSILAALSLSLSLIFCLPHSFDYYLIKLIEISLLIITVAIAAYTKFFKIKYSWIQTRRESEYLRAVERIIKSGMSLSDKLRERFKQKSIISQSKPKHISTPLIEVVENYIKQNVQHAFNKPYTQLILRTLITSQISYHEKRAIACQKNIHRLEICLNIIQYIFFASVGIEFIETINNLTKMHILHEICNNVGIWSMFFTVFMPALYAAVEAFAYFYEWNKNHIDSVSMKEFFELKLNDIEKIETKEEYTQLANTIFERMDAENYAWTLVFEEKPFRLF